MAPVSSPQLRIGGLACAVALATPCVASAQPAPTTTRDNQLWSGAFAQVRVTGRDPGATSGLSFWLDTHARRTAAGLVSILRPGLGYRLSPSANVWAGYASVGTMADETREWTLEQRAWQQALFTVDVEDRLTIQLRPRLEQRFRSGEDAIAHRARAFLRFNVNFGPKVPVLFASWNETFLHLNDVSWGPRAGFDQNRLFLGFGVRGPARSRVEIGYLNVASSRDGVLAIANNLNLNALSEF